MAVITKNSAGQNVTTSVLILPSTLRATAGADVVLIGDDAFIGGTIDLAGGIDELRFNNTTAAETYDLGGFTFGATGSIETVSLGTGVAAAPILTGALNHAIDASDYVLNGLTLLGNAGANLITGTFFADTFAGGGGSDTLYGGGGNDIFNVVALADYGATEEIDGEDGFDTLNFNNTVANATLTLNVDTNVEAVTIGGTVAANVNATAVSADLGLRITGNAAANNVIGSGLGDTITGLAGADNLSGLGGNDVFVVAVPTEYLSGATALLSDQINGGLGIDVIRFTSATAGQTLTLNAFITSVERFEIANLQGQTHLTTALNVDAKALAAGMTIVGNAGNNSITGTQAADTIQGGGGNDVILIGTATHHAAGESIDGGANADVIRFTATTVQTLTLQSLSNVETVAISDAAGSTAGVLAHGINASSVGYGIALVGNAGANSITGGLGNDTITGGLGNDILQGGAGNDVYVYNAATEFGLTETVNDSGGANDTVRVTTGTLTSGTGATAGIQVTGIETIELLGATATTAIGVVVSTLETDSFVITGNNGANAITAGGGNDTITGGLGADAQKGGAGDDVFVVGAVTELTGDSFDGGTGTDVIRLTAAAGTYTFAAGMLGMEEIEISDAAGSNAGTGAVNIVASALAATVNGVRFTGNAGNNSITGGAGADLIEGGAGNDNLKGGAGNDSIIYASSAHYTGDTVDGGLGLDTVLFNGTVNGDTLTLAAGTLGIEAVSMTGSAGLAVDASAIATALKLSSNGGGDTVTGTAAADTILAGAGDDLLLVKLGAHHGGTESIDGGADTDTLRFTSTLEGDTLFLSTANAGVELIEIANAAGDASGTTSLNVYAAAASNAITLTGNAGYNELTGGRLNDLISGGYGNDLLNGGSGDDTLVGGADADTLIGGAGNDRFNDIDTSDTIIAGRGTDDVIAMTGEGGNLDLTLAAPGSIMGVERVDITGTGDNTLVVDGAVVTDMVGAGGTLIVDGDAGDELTSDDNWVQGGNAAGYTDFTVDGVTIRVNNNVNFSRTFTATTGTDDLEGSTSGDTFRFPTGATMTLGDSVDGGGGDDTMSLEDGGTFDMTLITVTSIEVIRLEDGTIATLIVSDNAGNTYDIVVGGTGTGTFTIVLGDAGAGAQNVTTGTGDDTITLGAGDNWVQTGDGSDVVNGTVEAGDAVWLQGGNDSFALQVGSEGVIDGGSGTDTLTYDGESGSASIDLSLTNSEAGPYSNFENLAAATSGANLTVTAAAVGSNIATGSGNDDITAGAGNDTITTGSGSDVVHGQAAGDDVDLGADSDQATYVAGATVTGGSGTDELLVGSEAGALSITLGEGANIAGYSDFENLDGSSADGALTVTAAATGSDISTGSAADSITLGNGYDVVSAGAGNDTIHATETTFSDGEGDSLDGGGDSDTLSITGGGAIDLNEGFVTGIESILISDEGTTFTANGEDLAITAGNGGNTLYLGEGTQSVVSGTGDDEIALGSGANTIDAGGGSDTVTGTVGASDDVDLGDGADSYTYNAANTGVVRGGGDAAVDTLVFSGASLTLDLSSGGNQALSGTGDYRGFENLDASGASGTVDVTVGDNSTLIVATGSGGDTIRVTSSTIGGVTIDGGAGGDTLVITGGNTVNLSGVSAVETVTIDDNATTLIANSDPLAISAGDGGNTITLGSGIQSVSTGDGADSVALGGGTNIVNTGGGSDTVTGTVQLTDQVNLGAGSDSFGFTSIAGSVDGGADSDTLTHSGGTATIDLSATSAVAGVYSNFENLAASGATGNLTVTAAAAGGTIATGSGNDLIALGVGSDTINAGSSNDTLTGTLSAGDNVLLGSNSDTATYSGGVAATLDGGSGNDTLVVSGGSGTLAIDLSLGGDQIAGDGATVTQGFENLSAAGAAYNIAVTLASGSNSIVLGTGNDTIIATDALVAAATTIDGGAGANTLQVTDTASLADADFTSISNVQTLQLANAGGAQSVTLGTEAQQAGIVTLNASAATQSVSVNAAAYTVGVSITTGSAGDSIALGGSGADVVDAGGGADTVSGVGAGDNVSLGAGNDTFTYASVAATVNGGADVDTLYTDSGSAFTINLGLVGADQVSTGLGDYRDFENLDASGASGAIDVTVGANTTSVSTGGAGDSIRVSAGAVGVAAIDGNGGTDTLFITGSGTVTLTNVSDVEAIDISGGSVTFTANGNFAISTDNNAQTIILGTGTQSVTTGSGGDHITLGSGINVVNTNGGTDTVVGALSAGDTVNLGAGNDSYTYSVTAASNTINGGADVDTLVYAGSADIVIDFTTTADNIATELGAYSNFENLSASTATGDITVISTSGPGVFSITTGSGDDNVTTGTGDDSIETGAGSDTVLGAVGAGDSVSLGAGLDSYTHQVIDGIVDGGTSSDTLIYNGAFVSLNIDLGNTSDHFASGGNPAGAQTGSYRNFENLNVLGGNTTNITVIAATAGSQITTGGGNDSITLGTGTDIVIAGAGSDTVSGSGLGSGETISLGDNDDHFAYLATVDVSNIINGQVGNDWINYSGATSLSIDFSAAADNIAAEAGTYAGFENLGFGAASGNYVVVAATTGSIINTGSGTDSVTVGAGTDIVNTGGNSDTVSGALSAGDDVTLGADADTYNFSLNAATSTISGGADEDTMVVSGGSAVGFDLDLDAVGNQVAVPGTTGVYTGFEHLYAGEAAYDFSVNANSNGSSIITGSGTDLIIAGAGNDTVDAGSGNDTINITSATYSGDSYTGGANTDRLAVSGGGIINLGENASVTGFEEITIDADATELYSDGDGYSITAGDVTGGGGHYVDLVAGNNTVSTGAGNDTVNLGTGDDSVDMGDGSDSVEGTLSGNDFVTLGAGTDTFVWQVLTNAGNVVSGGADSDTLEITLDAAEAGTSSLTIEFDLADQLIGGATTGTYTAFENLDAAFTDIDLTVTAYSGAASTITTGSGDDTVYLDASGQTISTGEGSDSVAGGLTTDDTVDLGAEDDQFEYAVSGVTNSIDGGDGNDVLVVTGGTGLIIDFSVVANNIDAEAGTYLNFENLDAATSSGSFNVVAADTGSVITTGSGQDNVTVGGGADEVTLGSDVDSVWVTVGDHAGDSYDGGADDDYLVIVGSGDINLRGGPGNATVVGFDEVEIDASAAAVTLTMFDGEANVTAYNNANNTITLGAGAQNADALGTGNDTINLGSGTNFVSAGDGSDVVNGTVEATDEIYLDGGADSFAWRNLSAGGRVDGGTDGFTDTITHTGEGGFSLDLSPTIAGAGVYSNFEHLAASGADDGIEVYAAAAGSNIATGAGGDNIHVSTGDDTVTAGSGNDTVYINASNYDGDSVDGGLGNDTLDISGGLTIDLGDYASLTGVENIFISNETTLLITDEQGFTINVAAGTGAQSVNLAASGNANTVNLGDGADQVTLGGGADDVSMGDGSDVVAGHLTAGDDVDMGAGADSFDLDRNYDASSTIDGGAGVDTLLYADTPSITIDLSVVDADQVLTGFGVQQNFENVDFTGSTGDLDVTSGTGTTALVGGDGNDTFRVSAAQLNGTLTINGGAAVTVDMLYVNTAASGADTIGDAAFGDVSGIESLILGEGGNQVLALGETATTAGIYYVDATAADNVSITNLADNRSLTGGAGSDFFAIYGADEIVVGGAGNDSVYGATNDALDQVFLQGDNDTYTTGLAAATGLVDGGTGSDRVVYIGASPASFDLSDTSVGAGGYSNFENFDGSAAGSGVNVTVSGANGEIIGSGFGDNILVAGTGNDTIYAGGGSDNVTGTLSSLDQVYLETGNDSYTYQVLAAGNLVDAGADLDTLAVGSEQGTLTIDLTNGTDQVAGLGTYRNFENVAGGSADDALDVTVASASTSVVTGTADDTIRVTATTLSSVTIDGGADATDDTLAISGGGTVNLTTPGVDVMNVEIISLDVNATTLTVDGDNFTINGATATTGGHTINLGTGNSTVNLLASNDTVNLNSGIDLVNMGDGSDTVNGNLSAGDAVNLGLGDDSFDLVRIAAAGSTVNGGGGTDTLVFNGTSGVSPSTVDLSSGTDQAVGGDAGDADYLGFENIDFAGSDDPVNVTMIGATTSIITTNGGDIITDADGVGAQSVNAGSGDDTLNTTAANFIGDTLNGGVGTADRIAFTGGGTFNMNSAVISGFEVITIDSTGTTFTANDDALSVTIAGGNNTSTLGNNASQTLVGGAGNDGVTLGAQGQNVTLGDGTNAAYTTATSSIAGSLYSTIAGGSGTDTLFVAVGAGGFNITMPGSVSGVEIVDLTGTNGIGFQADNTVGLTVNGVDGGSGDTLSAGTTEQTLNGRGGNDLLIMNAGEQTLNGGAGNDTLQADGTMIGGSSISGGADNDTVNVIGGGSFSMANVNFDVEFVTLASATNLTANGDGTLTITGSGGADTITVGHAAQVVNAGADNDVVRVTDAMINASLDIDGQAGTNTLVVTDAANIADADFSANLDNFQTLELSDIAGAQSVELGIAARADVGITTLDADALTGTNSVTVDAATYGNAPLTVLTGNGADAITVNQGATNVSAAGGDDTISTTAVNYTGDTIDGGLGTDTLRIYGAAGSISVDSAIENIRINTASAITLTLTAGEGYAVSVDQATDGNHVVNLGSNSMSSFLGADGNETVTIGVLGQDVFGELGNDTINAGANLVNGGTTIDGEGGTDVVNLTAAGTANFTLASVSGIETVNLTVGGITLVADAGTYTINGFNGGSGDVIVLGSAAQAVNGNDGNDTVVATDSIMNGSPDLNGDGGTDVLEISDTASTDDADLLNVDGFETLRFTTAGGSATLSTNADAAGFVTFDGSAATSAITLTIDDTNFNNGLNITTGSGGDSLNLGDANVEFVLTGTGNDTVSDFSAGDNVYLDYGIDTAHYEEATATIDGGSNVFPEADTLVLDIDDANGGQSFDFTSLTDQNGTGAGNDGVYTNFENLAASASDDNLTVLTAVDTTSIVTGSGTDVVTLGSNFVTTVTTNAGNDTINATSNTFGSAGTINMGNNAGDTVIITDTALLIDADFFQVSGVSVLQLANQTGVANHSVTIGAGNFSGTGIDSINAAGVGDDTVTINASGLNSGAALNYATADGNDTITLANGSAARAETVTMGQGNDLLVTNGALSVNDSIALGIGNDTFRYANDIADGAGTAAVMAGADLDLIDDNSGFGGTFDFSTTANNATVDGITYSDFENLLGSGSNAYTVTLHADSTSIVTAGGNDTINVTASTLGSSDTIDANGGSDQLNINGAGTFTLNSTNAQDFEVIQDDASVDATTLVMNNLTGVTINMDGGNDTVTMGGVASQTIDGGAGNDTIVAGAAGQSIAGGAGDDHVAVTGTTIASIIDGGSGAESTGDSLGVAGGGTVDMNSGTITNFEHATLGISTNFTANGDSTLTIAGSTANDTITVGHENQVVNAGTGDDVIRATSTQLNAVMMDLNGDGQTTADRLVVTDDASLDDADFTSIDGIEVLELTTSGNAQSVTLAAEAAGAGLTSVTVSSTTMTGALTIDAGEFGAGALNITTAAGNDTIVASAGGGTITANDGDDIITLSSGNNTISGGAGNDEFYAASIEAGDSITGGSQGTQDFLVLTTGTSYTLNANILGIERILDDSTEGTTLVLNNEAYVSVVMQGGNDVVTMGNNSLQAVYGGFGDDFITLGAAGQTVSDEGAGSGDGADTIVINATTDASTIDGGSTNDGTGDTLRVVNGGTVVMSGTTTNMETVVLFDAGGTDFTANTDATLTINGNATGNDTITLGDGAQVVNADGGTDFVVIQDAYLDGTLDVDGGGGTDVLQLSNAASFADADIGADVDSFEELRFSTAGGSATLDTNANSAGFVNVNASAATSAVNITFMGGFTNGVTVTGGSAADSFTLSGANQSINGNGGDDTIHATDALFDANLTLNGGLETDAVNLGSGDVSIVDGDFTAISSVETLVIGAGVTGHSITLAGEAGDSGLNLVNATAATQQVVVNASAFTGATLTINTGSAGDIITITTGGGTTETVDAGNGADTVSGTLSGGDNVSLGAGTDTYNFGINAASTTISGGGDDDLLVVTGGSAIAFGLDLSSGGNQVTLSGASGSYQGFEDLDGSGASYNFTVMAASGGSVIQTGTGTDSVIAGISADTIETNDSNDTINITSATFGVGDSLDGGAQSDTLAITGGGTVDLTLGGTTVIDIENITLGTTALTLISDGDGYSITGDNSTGHNVTLTAGTNTVIMGTGADTVSLGSGNDAVSMGGGVDSVSGIVGASDSVFLEAGVETYTYNLLNAGLINAGADDDTLLVGSESGALSIDFTSGGDQVSGGGDYRAFENLDGATTGDNLTVTVAAASTSIVSGTGNDTINVTSTTILGVTINGTSGTTDTLAITGGGAISMASVSNMDAVTIDDTATQLTANNENLAITAGNGSNTITLGSGTQSVAGTMGGADIVSLGTGGNNVAMGGGDDTINATSSTYGAGDTLDGGSHDVADWLSITGGGTFDMTSGTISNIEEVLIDGNATVFTANGDNLSITGGNGGNTITLGAGTQNVSMGSGGDTVNLGGGNNSVNTGGGSDTVTGTVQAGDNIFLDEGNDSFTYQALDGDVDAGNGSDTLTVTNNASLVIDFSTTANNIDSETGFYSFFENLAAGASSGTYTVIAAAAGSSITTGSGGDTVTLGVGADTLFLGYGNDTVTSAQALSASDNINLGEDADSFTYSAAGTSVVVNGGTGGTDSDTLAFTGSGTIVMDLSAGSVADQIALETGVYQNFENVAGAGSSINFTVTDGAGTNSIVTGSGTDTFIISGGSHSGEVFDAGSSGDILSFVGGGTLSMLDGGTWLGFETVNISATGGIFIANSTVGLAINGVGGVDDITVGASSQQINAGLNDDIIRITAGSVPSSLIAGGGTDTLVISGGGTFTLVGTTGLEIVHTGTASVVLSLSNSGITVQLQGGVNHTVNAGNGDDKFVFEGPAAQWAGNTVAINDFLQGANNDQIDLSLLGIQSYDGEDGVLTAFGSVYNTTSEVLEVDLNGDAVFDGSDLSINLGDVTALTQGVDLLVAI